MKTALFVGGIPDEIVSISEKLFNSGYQIQSVCQPIEAMRYCTENTVEVILAYNSLNAIDGQQFLALVKASNSRIKTVLWSKNATDELELNVIKNGLDLLLDLKRSHELQWEKLSRCLNYEPKQDAVLEEGKIRINYLEHTVHNDNALIHLTPKEFDVLDYFVRNKNRVIARKEMIEALWDHSISEYIDDRTVDVHVKRIRDKIGYDVLISVRGIGYKWKTSNT